MNGKTKRLGALGLIVAAAGVAALLGAGAADADGRHGRSDYDHGGARSMGHHSGPGMGYHGGGHGGSRAHKMMEGFDSDGDGKLSQAEIDGVRTERLTAFDRDGDKALTLQEYEALWLDAMRERMVDRFQDLDADGSGTVTVEEFAQPFAQMVKRMDRNRDGVLSLEDHPRRKSDDDG